MNVVSFKVFQGRNIYSHKKCIRLDVDLDGYNEMPNKEIYGFNEKILEMLPKLSNHISDIDEYSVFIEKISHESYLADITKHIILVLHNMIGLDIKYAKSKQISGDNYYIIYQYEYRNTSIDIGNIAVDLANSLIDNKPLDLDLKIKKLKEILMGEQLGISTLNIYNEAKKRGIPVLRIGENSLLQLGYGKYAKTIQATMGNETSALAVNIAQDKLLTKEVLSMNFLPVAIGNKVKDKLDSIKNANDIGYPVVLKPQFGNQGKGVIANIKDDAHLSTAYDLLIKDYKDILIEKCIIGRDYRICYVYGDIVAVSERLPPFILGDGISSIEKLIEITNEDLRRGEGHEKELTKIKIDETLLAYLHQKNYSLTSILIRKEKLNLRDNANLSTGGFAIDCTEVIFPENMDICKRAAEAIGLDICGIDLICEDISKPLNGGVIIEINAAPGIRMHHNPYIGAKRNVAGHIVDKLFENTPKTIPIVSITGTNGKTTTTRLIGHILKGEGYTVGMTTTGGIYIDDKCIFKGDTTGPNSALVVLTNNNVDAAVLETARGGIIRRGLAYDLADVAVITNITEDHLGMDEVETMDELAKVKALVGESVKKDGYVVINADDKMSISIIHRFKSNLIIFATSKYNKIIKNNINNGGYGLYIDNNNIIIQKGTLCEKLIDVKAIGITMNGALNYNIENAMAACCAAIALGVNHDTIREGLMSFYCSPDQNPGRFNMYDVNNIKVVLDYGHNLQSYRCVLAGVKNIKHNKLIGIIGAPGDRQENYMLEVGKCAGENFDYIFIKENKDRRGKKIGSVADIIEKGILSSKFNILNIEKVLVETEAFRMALDSALPGDIVVAFVEHPEPFIEIMKTKINQITRNSKLFSIN